MGERSDSECLESDSSSSEQSDDIDDDNDSDAKSSNCRELTTKSLKLPRLELSSKSAVSKRKLIEILP